ncbi:GNAT family N-acetyltransferase [Dehalobacter sp. DCM]|uniref:GNAT family N-acetyltransferase n=1 Tax=Dehalobacter sp. DCM TaxID=2907827 RepID=UPI003081BC63|nr:GNAT family N-acetyltransferase [Dehalobacter sp. DCM]
MAMIIREFQNADVPAMVAIWNHVVDEANAFPQMEKLTEGDANEFFASQTFTGVALLDDNIVGLYVLHPNYIGRCGHIANASYAVDRTFRGLHMGEELVRHSIKMGRKSGFQLLQFNAVVSTNAGAIHLYEKIGFHRVGVIPKGYLNGYGNYDDIIIYYIEL